MIKPPIFNYWHLIQQLGVCTVHREPTVPFPNSWKGSKAMQVGHKRLKIKFKFVLTEPEAEAELLDVPAHTESLEALAEEALM